MWMDLFTSTLQALNGHCVSGYNSSGSKAPLRRKVRKTSRRKRKRRRYGYSCRASGNEKYSNNYNNNNNNNRSNSNSNSNSNNHNNNRKNVNMQSSQCHTVKYNDNDDNNDHDDVVVAVFAKNNDNDDHDDVDVDNKCKIVVNNVRKMPRMHSINNKQHNMNINYNNKSSNQRNDISKSNRKSNNHDSNGNNGSYCLGARDSKKMTTLLTSPITVTKNTTALPTALPTTATATAMATGRVIRPPTKIEQVQLCQNKRRKTRRREIGSEADPKEPKCLYSREKYTAAAAAAAAAATTTTTTTIAATSATMVERKFKSATFHSHLAAMATPRKTAKGLSSTPCTFVWRHRHCWFSIRWPHTLHKSYAVIFMAMLVFSICHKSVLNAMAVQIPKGNSTDEVDTGKSPITFTVQLNEYPPNKQHDVHSQQQVQMKPQMEGQLQTPSQLSESHNNEIYQKKEEEMRRETEIPRQEKQQQMQSFSTEFIFNSGMSLGTNNNHTFQSLSIIDGGGLMADTSQSLLSQMTSFDNDDFTYPLTKDAMPIFDFGMPRNITARTGHTEAVIRCRVDRLDDKSVSWIRKRDLHILTVGTATYTSDKRFQVTESKDSREWTLHVKSPQARDSGIYECQVNTEPKISMAFQLNVIEISPDAKAVITGPADLHFKVGSAIILTCIVYQPSVKDIGPIYWYRGEYMITPFDINDLENEIAQPTLPSNIGRAIEDNVKPGTPSHAAHKTDSLEGYSEGEQLPNEITQDFTQRIAMESQLGDTMKSRLRISNAQASDTGNYTCQPTTASSASVMVHVINDENPAAMQKSRGEGLKSMTMTTAIVIGLANVSSKLLVLMLTTAFSFNTLLKFLCHEN